MPTKTNKSQTPIPLLIIYRQKTNIKKNHTSHPHQTHSNRLSIKRKTETKTQTVLRDMQPERDRGGTSEEDRRLKPMAAPDNQQQQHQQQQQPQKCPRCESLNTKFCYYNNYSLSQPRYFCKTCRRYWTQGGTLRNVPVGGGCRKGKRAKTSSSSENSRSQTQTPPPPAPPPSQAHQQVQQNLTAPSKIMSSSPVMTTSPAGMRSMEPGALPSQYYPGAGYFSSLAAIQSLNQPQTFNHQELDAGCELGSSSNMSLLQGFNVSTFGSQHHQPHQIQPSQFYQMGSRDKSNFEPLNYPSEENLLQTAGRHASSSSPHDHWPQSFMNNSTTTSMTSESALWNMGNNTNTATGSVHTKTTTSSGPSFNPNQWPDLPGYGPPP